MVSSRLWMGLEVPRMGITIHYTLITDHYPTVLMSIKLVEEAALRLGYKVERIEEDGYVEYSTFSLKLEWRDPEGTKMYLKERWGGFIETPLQEVPDEPPWPWIAINYPMDGWHTYATPWTLSKKGRPARFEGVVVDCGTAEPFSMVFYKIGRYYVCDGFTKTQAFTVDEVGPNTQFHKWICHVLKKLEKDGVWWNFYVGDEAEYYETLDESKIVDGFQLCNKLIYSLAEQVDKIFEEQGVDIGLSIGGRDVDIRRMRKRAEELEGSGRTGRQSVLDEFEEGWEDE